MDADPPPVGPRIALFADYLEEGWPSMDLVAGMLAQHLPAALSADRASVHCLRPVFRSRLSRLWSRGRAGRAAWNFDRLANRLFDYPRFARTRRAEFDLFHLVDHSYSQLLHELPAGRAVVTCHDLDTFRCLWEPNHAGRGWAFVAMSRRILKGLQKAAHVCCDSIATRDELLARGVLSPGRMSVVRLGVHPAFLRPPAGATESGVDVILRATSQTGVRIDLLHVGSVIPRKRIDILLQVFARLLKVERGARLLRVGGKLTESQQSLAARLGVTEAIVTLPSLTAEQLAVVYRRATLLLLPSETEGFGLPIVEAMACGTPVLVSDLPVLREVGGDVADYAPVADIEKWTAKATALLTERRDEPELWEDRRERCRRQAAKFSWAETARRTAEIYRACLAICM
jgi:glycosyltransferase involved in cell wall biosynthesis